MGRPHGHRQELPTEPEPDPADAVELIAQDENDSKTPEVSPNHRRTPSPTRWFRALGVLLLVLIAVAGGFVAVSHSTQSTSDDLSLDATRPSFASVTPSAVSPSEPALTDAGEWAAAAAASAAADAKTADDAAKRKAEQEAATRSEPRVTTTYPVPASCSDYSGNRATGCAVLLERGFGLDQMPCLDKLFAKESGWNEKARNKSSGAFGIPQALPGTKMASEGADWETNPATQIKWGLTYIKNRYTTPCAAWAHSQSVGSY